VAATDADPADELVAREQRVATPNTTSRSMPDGAPSASLRELGVRSRAQLARRLADET
jgi:hypothetical protein